MLKKSYLPFFLAMSVLLTAADGAETSDKAQTPAPEAAAPEAPQPPSLPPKPPEKLLRFRFGTILAAEYTGTKPAISDPDLKMARASGPNFVQIVILPDRGRSISIHDFALSRSGSEYPCVAVAEGGDPYSGVNWIFRYTNGETCYRLLFAVPSTDGEFKLVFKLFDSKLPPLPFKLKNASSGFTPAGSIPASGALILPPPPPPPPPPPAPEAKNDSASPAEKPKTE